MILFTSTNFLAFILIFPSLCSLFILMLLFNFPPSIGNLGVEWYYGVAKIGHPDQVNCNVTQQLVVLAEAKLWWLIQLCIVFWRGRHNNQHRVLYIKMTRSVYSRRKRWCRNCLEEENLRKFTWKVIATTSKKLLHFECDKFDDKLVRNITKQMTFHNISSTLWESDEKKQILEQKKMNAFFRVMYSSRPKEFKNPKKTVWF